jgi:hypothetical protein
MKVGTPRGIVSKVLEFSGHFGGRFALEGEALRALYRRSLARVLDALAR